MENTKVLLNESHRSLLEDLAIDPDEYIGKELKPIPIDVWEKFLTVNRDVIHEMHYELMCVVDDPKLMGPFMEESK